MALTLQRKLELAGELAKVQPMLQRLHLVDKPKERHHVRNVVLVGSAFVAVAAVVVTLRRRRGRDDGAALGSADDVQLGSVIEDTPPTDFDQSVSQDSAVEEPV